VKHVIYQQGIFKGHTRGRDERNLLGFYEKWAF
jgi:hypothetical protein